MVSGIIKVVNIAGVDHGEYTPSPHIVLTATLYVVAGASSLKATVNPLVTAIIDPDSMSVSTHSTNEYSKETAVESSELKLRFAEISVTFSALTL